MAATPVWLQAVVDWVFREVNWSAWATMVLALVAFVQLRRAIRSDRLAAIPDLFLKDISLRQRPGKPDEKSYWRFELLTRGIANLSSDAVAIHALYVLDDKDRKIAGSWPLLPIPAGQVLELAPIASGLHAPQSESRYHLTTLKTWPRGQESGTSEDGRPIRHVDPDRLEPEAHQLAIQFRYGGTPNQMWEQILERSRLHGDRVLFQAIAPKPPTLLRLNERARVVIQSDQAS